MPKEMFFCRVLNRGVACEYEIKMKVIQKQSPAWKEVRWCRVRDFYESQIPRTTGGFELRISFAYEVALTH